MRVLFEQGAPIESSTLLANGVIQQWRTIQAECDSRGVIGYPSYWRTAIDNVLSYTKQRERQALVNALKDRLDRDDRAGFREALNELVNADGTCQQL